MSEFDEIDPARMAQVQRETHQEHEIKLRDARKRLASARDEAAYAEKRERQFRPEFHSWRMIDNPVGSATVRMEVPGGWLYKYTSYTDGYPGTVLMVFVPRPAGE